MMRVFDETESVELNAKEWQIELLKKNPNYVHWGPHEDYMWVKGQGWNCAIIEESWSSFGPWQLDDMNECVNFYFSINRKNIECPICHGDGYHIEAHRVVNTFYSHQNPEGEHWNDKITQDELEALILAGRLGKDSTVEEINERQRACNVFDCHDAINRFILIEARLKRLGLKRFCETCAGEGIVYTEPDAHVSLTLWMLHPRKGCSRGVEITEIQESELPEIFAWLRQAAERNAKRFSSI